MLAAAIRCRAGVIVTLNLRDFPDEVVSRYGIPVQHPDEFLAHPFDLKPAVVCTAVREMRASLANPPKTVRELLDDRMATDCRFEPRQVSRLATFSPRAAARIRTPGCGWLGNWRGEIELDLEQASVGPRKFVEETLARLDFHSPGIAH